VNISLTHYNTVGFRLAAAAILLVFVLLAVSLWPATLDDAFISYRYARNLADGNGPVFNPGERVEGYSNPLWVLLLSAFIALGMNAEWVSKALGLGCGIGIIVLAMGMLRRHFRASPPLALLLGAWLATSIGLLYYAISGLETLFYSLQLLILIQLLLQRRFGWAALVSVTLLITRPEGMLFILPLALCAGMERKNSRAWWRYPLASLAGLGLVTLWRWSYYGALLPNTFNAKIKTHWGFIQYALWHTQTFVNYAWQSFSWNDLVPAFALFYALFLLRRRDLAPAAVLGCLLFFVWFSGSDWMSFGRFYVPALPVIGLFAFAAQQSIVSALEAHGLRGPRLWIWLALPVLFNLVAFYYASEELQSGQSINPAMHSRPHRAIGLWLRDHAHPGERLVVNEIGAIGYYSNLPIIDMIGLTDKTIPYFWKNGDLAGYARFIMAQKPRYIALNDRQAPGDEGMDPVHLALYECMKGGGGYKLIRIFELKSGKNLLLFERIGP
jgi:arabinofuranosyltransferase